MNLKYIQSVNKKIATLSKLIYSFNKHVLNHPLGDCVGPGISG